jgi:hypothetical protein
MVRCHPASAKSPKATPVTRSFLSRESCFACNYAPGFSGTPVARGNGGFPSRSAKMEQERKDDKTRKNGVEGEGSYSGTKDYNERTEKFIKSGKVDKGAKDAEPKSEEEKHAMQKAERIGKQKAKK